MSIAIAASATSEAANGTGTPLSAESQPGDVAVLIASSQLTEPRWPDLPGWNVVKTENVNNRAGYVAVRKVDDPAQTQGIAWHDTRKAYTSRQNAILVVLRGAEVPAPVEWKGFLPDLNTTTLVATQQHYSKDTKWTDHGLTIHAGAASAEVSWSTLDAGLISSKQDLVNAQAVLAMPLVAVGGTPEIPAPIPQPLPQPRPMPGPTNQWVKGVQVLTPGARTPDDLLKKKGFVVAHRGGSDSWPESSMKAYTQAVAAGADALEISCHRTKDGVWFASHDINLHRVDSSAPSTDVRQMTWEEVNKYKTMGEPILKAEDLLKAYGDSHVLVIDPKNSAADVDSLFALGFNPATTIVKFYYDAAWLANKARALGFKTWGYAYEADLENLKKAAGNWDYLGMNFDASEETWRQVTALGKPVWGHICPSKEAYARAMRLGAAGCMVSNVSAVLPDPTMPTTADLAAHIDAITVPTVEKPSLTMAELGAKADGVADDAPALREGFKRLAATGGTIVFEAGKTYSMPGWVQGLGKGITLEGNGAIIDRGSKGGILFASQATNNQHIPDGGEDFTVRNLRFKGSYIEGKGLCVFSLHHARNITVEGCVFDQCYGGGGHVFDAVAVDGLTIRDCTWYGRNVAGDGTLQENIQLGASLQGTLSHEQATGFDGVACSNVLVENCRFLPSTPVGVGPNILGSHDKLEHGTHRNVVIRGCTVVNPYANGGKNGGSIIELHSVKGLTVEGNTFVCKTPTDARVVEVTGRQTGIKADRDLNVKPDWNHDDPITPLPVEDVTVVGNRFFGFALKSGNTLVRLSGNVPPMVTNGVMSGNIIKWAAGNQGTESDLNVIGVMDATNLVL